MLIFEAATDLRLMDWVDEPATEQQLIYLRELGFTLGTPLRMTEAARLIRELRRNPGRLAAATTTTTAVVEPAGFAARSSPPVPQAVKPRATANDFSESTRVHVHKLRAAVEAAHRALAANSNGPNVRADAAASIHSRQEFWLDTCREVKEMRIGSVPVFELYQMQGCRFFPPNHEQVQELLDALDAAMPLWDRDNPELFYQTLELNFPHLVKRC
jgi:hypothetical protein